jgi:hypothetical protein
MFFPKLPLIFQAQSVLEDVGSALGKFLCSHQNVQHFTRPGVPGICVELDLREPLPPAVIFGKGKQSLVQKIEYGANTPRFCHFCGRVGHDIQKCRNKASSEVQQAAGVGEDEQCKMQWRPKRTTAPAVNVLSVPEKEKDDLVNRSSRHTSPLVDVLSGPASKIVGPQLQKSTNKDSDIPACSPAEFPINTQPQPGQHTMSRQHSPLLLEVPQLDLDPTGSNQRDGPSPALAQLDRTSPTPQPIRIALDSLIQADGFPILMASKSKSNKRNKAKQRPNLTPSMSVGLADSNPKSFEVPRPSTQSVINYSPSGNEVGQKGQLNEEWLPAEIKCTLNRAASLSSESESCESSREDDSYLEADFSDFVLAKKTPRKSSSSSKAGSSASSSTKKSLS